MNRKLLSVLVGLLLSLPTFAQTNVQRNLVVVESSTGTWCVFCPGSALGTEEMSCNADKVAILKYHGFDAYENTDSQGRINYYGITSYPSGRVDGATTVSGGSQNTSIYSDYQPAINTSMGLTTPIDIEMDVKPMSGQTYDIQIRLHNIGGVQQDSLKLRLAITESHIAEQWFFLEEVNYTVRQMIPNHEGTYLDINAAGTRDTLDFSVPLSMTWDPNNVEFIAFVQGDQSKQIYNGVKRPTYEPTSGVDMAFGKNLIVDSPSSCADSYTPEFLVINKGDEMISSLNFEYQINGGPIQTETWAGELDFYETARIELPSIFYTSEEDNFLSINIVNPNGQTDMNLADNELQDAWSGRMGPFGNYLFYIEPGLNGNENNWIIKNDQFGILAAGGPYPAGNNQPVIEQVSLPVIGNNAFSCYRFEMYDTQGNGLTDGKFFLISTTGDTVVSNPTGEFENTYTSELTLTWATGIDDLLAASFAQIFPNPSAGQYQIRLSAPNLEKTYWQVFDLSGRLIQQGESARQEWELDLTEQSSGIYQCVLRSSDKIWTQKLYK
ncbi:MAG: Omp28-related outer membrane protein, partial [Bacteroidota bacterium]